MLTTQTRTTGEGRPASGFQRRLTRTDLTMTAIGGLIGSGWLFSALAAATIAGPASIVSWIIGGVAVVILGLAFAELSATYPEAGGVIRFPQYSHGTLVSFLMGWAAIISWAAAPAMEAEAVLEYSAGYLPGLYSSAQNSLTGWGFAAATALLGLFFALNYLGVQLYAKVNTPVTFIKLAAPTMTIIALILTAFHSGNWTRFGGFAPYGANGVFTAIAAGGIVFSFTGFRPLFDLAGEAKNPQRDIPWAFMAAMVIASVVYLLLQTAFIGAVPASDLARGWAHLAFSSPFAKLALALNMSWLAVILYADAVISPGGSSLVYAAAIPRALYAFARNGYFPKIFLRLNKRGIPAVTTLASFLIAMAFLLPFPSWQKMVSIVSGATIMTYMIGPVALMTLRRTDPRRHRPYRLGRAELLAPAGFVIGSLIFYWSGWPTTGWLLALTAAGAVVYVGYFVKDPSAGKWNDLRAAWWLIAFLLFVVAMSAAGSFGGHAWLRAPWDTLGVALGSLGFYYWGVFSGIRHGLAEAQRQA